MAWVDTPSETFVARHDERDAEDAERVLAQLEYARMRLEEMTPSSVSGSTSTTSKPRPAPASASRSGVPARSFPKAPSGVITTATGALT